MPLFNPLFGAVCFICMALVAASVRAEGLNVRSFGARGDGMTDDTQAIQRAADAAFAVGGEDARCMSLHHLGGTDGPFSAVVFPEGTYRISGTINFQRNVAILGNGAVKIVNERPEKNTFHCREAHRLIVKGITFVGGAIQLKGWTKNRDVAYLHVSDCVFKGATKTAVVCDSYKNEQNVTCEDGTIPDNNSTLILIERCEFRENDVALHVYSDGTTVRNCRFVAPSSARHEQIRAGSGGILGVEMNFRDSSIDYPGRTEVGTAAIRYDGGRVTFENMDIRSKDDLIVVRSYSRFNEYGAPSMLDLIDVRLSTGRAPVVSLEGDNFPNRIQAYDLKSADEGKKKLFVFDVEPTLASVDDHMRNAQVARGIPAEHCLAFSTRGLDAARFDDALPACLEKYRRAPIPTDIKRPLVPRSGSLFALDLPTGPTFSDDTIGRRRRENPGDDTEKVGKLLAAAEEAGGGVVELPARWIRLSHGFRLPNKTRITCQGRAAIELTEREGSVFTVDGGSAVDSVFERVLFVEGGSAVTARASKGRIRFLDCGFYGQKNFAICAHSAEPNGLQIEVSGGQAYEPFLYRGNAETTFDPFWFELLTERPVGEFRSSYAAIVNEKGGRLTVREMLGVPCYFVNYPKSVGWDSTVNPEKNGEIRWIDNHGVLLSLGCRYGGEWGGITPIYHFGNAKTHLEGGVVELFGRLMRSHTATVVADTCQPDVTICRGVAADWRNPIEVAWKMPDGDYAAASKVRVAGCSPFTDYSPVWIDDQACTNAPVTRFVAEFDWDGRDPARLELKVAHAAEVWLNGDRVGKDTFCVPWGLSRVRYWSLAPKKGRNVIAIAVQNVCHDAVHRRSPLAYLDAMVIAGEHVLAWSAVDGHFRAMRGNQTCDGWQVRPVAAADAIRLKQCHNGFRVEKAGPCVFDPPAGLN